MGASQPRPLGMRAYQERETIWFLKPLSYLSGAPAPCVVGDVLHLPRRHTRATLADAVQVTLVELEQHREHGEQDLALRAARGEAEILDEHVLEVLGVHAAGHLAMLPRLDRLDVPPQRQHLVREVGKLQVLRLHHRLQPRQSDVAVLRLALCLGVPIRLRPRDLHHLAVLGAAMLQRLLHLRILLWHQSQSPPGCTESPRKQHTTRDQKPAKNKSEKQQKNKAAKPEGKAR
eukprot:scaffold214_cov249-Pinguiococcus_pyrenoidosus.AAC.17